MNIVEEAFKELYPQRELSKNFEIKYSGRFKGYNANIRANSNSIVVSASAEWRTVSKEIKKGLIQELLVRVHNDKKHTLAMDLYTSFIKNMSKVATRKISEPFLEKSFIRVNENMFGGVMNIPNLKWGNGINRLGTYEYATDTITISKILADDLELLDYVMHHEMLHKKHKFKSKAGRSRHHTGAFLREERKYPNQKLLEKRLGRLIQDHKGNKSWLQKLRQI